MSSDITMTSGLPVRLGEGEGHSFVHGYRRRAVTRSATCATRRWSIIRAVAGSAAPVRALAGSASSVVVFFWPRWRRRRVRHGTQGGD